ncbi:bifunctional isocitrate dehydrogenase kinase/phosphatase [Ectothiorhodospira lacustris]|uniref:bifunctional isocitrate dehydrogenase kinase/phosphatase n=1 Tax=Ectothiorhodospira lacustris TaxID=2899127 RepID=UPI001EE9225A|nr:bifunctional isocitrate dehydrogenase kinase/phosphatase [Ectothiorhodospira lacustris]MCG5500550.1 bifunctional isocitrate dehydrogenase kinase/phosphatase [Ectothiorhodospira lacustris]MCG5509377.1 bifunctional isocitrate dehydrogenase kinase/phosphatase [Ectothiorhodospira lacustris]MCG5521431.1 bifunctional isocitrate dehydrogenase kinase/phosphatase [Ectothiorhodospira lacustris]
MNERARQIARSILTGFERHFSFFQEITSSARERFEHADWDAVRAASVKRISSYDQRVQETLGKVRATFGINGLEEGLWQLVKIAYMDLLQHHSRPELAETFYNSVFCRLFERKYYNNDMIFLESVANRKELAERYRGYLSFHTRDGGVDTCIWEILSAFYFNLPHTDLAKDVHNIARALEARSKFGPEAMGDLRIDVLEFPFFRNKAAYLIGRVVHEGRSHPFIIPLNNIEGTGLVADALLTTEEEAEAVFSFARAYFVVKTPVPAATVVFLQDLMPDKPVAELYMSIGFHKQAKNEFYRDFLRHLANSTDHFSIAPGTPGLVMVVFTLPSYPYVFKVIKDRFPPQKDVTHELIERRYLQVKMHDRVGRMADTLEFSEVAFPLARFSPGLLEVLKNEVTSQVEIGSGNLVIKHLYIEKRMLPLDVYLGQADEAGTRAALEEWGLAIKQLIGVNIFPGDLLFKNFGVTDSGKVVFYDYDEICYLTECHFRKIPPSPFPEDELSSDAWYSAGPNEIFPEEFPTFLSTDPRIRRLLMQLHRDLFDYRYWQRRQEDVKKGIHGDVFPYPQGVRFDTSLRPEAQAASSL